MEVFMSSTTVVICAYTEDRWATLQRAIEVARKQISFSDELLVVVDHNESLLTRCRDVLDDCVVIPNSHMRGLSGARNTALAKARGSIIVFLDDDAVPFDGWFDALHAPYADRRVSGVGGFAKPRWQDEKPRWFPDEFLWVVGCSHRGLPSTTQPVRNLVGANMSFRKAAFDAVGGFTESMGRVGDRPLGCEETEFSIRLTQAHPDTILLYNPSAQVEHYVPEQRGSVRYFTRRCWAEGLSKAEVSRRVGRSSALSAERHHALQVLPKGILRGLRNASTGDIWGAMRAAAIVHGLVITAAGYCAGNLRRPQSGGKSVEARETL
jgi:glycosyltransferase involved in cell wall biosynthesis